MPVDYDTPPMQPDKLAFLFPGQGSQYAAMGSYLYQQHPPSRKLFEEADATLGYALSSLILEGPESKLQETEITQPALLTVSVATANYLAEQGVTPTCMAGHSLGEYSALVVAKSLSFATAIKLTQLRGRYMQAAVPSGVGTMAAILGLEDEQVEQFCQRVSQSLGVVEPAGYNCPGQVVVAGVVPAVQEVMQLAKAEGAKSVALKVSAPFHCSLLLPAAEKLAVELANVSFQTPQIPYFSNVDGTINTHAGSIAEKLKQQVFQPVRWRQTLMNMLLMGVQRFIEVGPGRVCVGHLKKVERRRGERAAIFAITDKEADIKNVLELLASPPYTAAKV